MMFSEMLEEEETDDDDDCIQRFRLLLGVEAPTSRRDCWILLLKIDKCREKVGKIK